ncbi:hypothetical protein D3C79_1099440 [compost metagenome]
MGGLSWRCSGVAKAMPPAAMLSRDSVRIFTPERPAVTLRPLAFQKRVCLRTRWA